LGDPLQKLRRRLEIRLSNIEAIHMDAPFFRYLRESSQAANG
jgi:hypothetical protein